MGVIVPLNEAIASVDWQCNGRTDVATWTLGLRPDDSLASPATIAQAMFDALSESLLTVAANYSNQWTYLGVRVYKRVTGGMVPANIPASQVGTAAWNPVPSNCAILVSKTTAFGGRRNRGRIYLPPIYAQEVNIGSGGQMTGSDVTLLQSKFTAFLGELAEGAVVPVIQHSDGSPSTVVTAFTVQSLLATQRGRLR